ncbi:MAG: 2,3-epoxybenzoyl-CoA dihydrolase [Myxococcota bacterium]|jgi:benzoyl-CoA-dihydrodiol lyase|nr:2,3-epoxybenzoyl-CoA dihydrolase [Myxococcota bacterium]
MNVTFQRHPSSYNHWNLAVDGAIATVTLGVNPEVTMAEGYELKLNSYDLGVDIELADLLMRLRFEHPGVACVVLRANDEKVWCAGANILMLRSSTHHFKVNFCKFTNETRFAIEDAQNNSGQHWIAAVRGVCAGGGYELAACANEILLADDGRSAVSLPEVPLLGVLPGTGGLTRVVDKRKVRRDHADVFSTLSDGLRAKRAEAWRLVDEAVPLSNFEARIAERAQAAAEGATSDKKGIVLSELKFEKSETGYRFEYVSLDLQTAGRTATLTMRAPSQSAAEIAALSADEIRAQGDQFWALKAYRDLNEALLVLRFNHIEIGTVLIKTEGDADAVLAMDAKLAELQGSDWFVREMVLYMGFVLRRLDLTARSFFALIEEASCFAGNMLELALAADRSYLLEDEEGQIGVSVGALAGGDLPMSNGLNRIEIRFLHDEQAGRDVSGKQQTYIGAEAEKAGLVTYALDDIDYPDELRLAIEERASLSPDALTGMEANLRFAGVETMETKVFGRLSAWQNWIFQRPNAVGETGALQSFGEPTTPQFDWRRT